ncbi:metallo-beta-lactamase superfamily protein [Colletotrichum truncatum]|uniref:Metallo-beta-lactamase superfamily protein n=1 Tax=Colletotrichum truncatum TaxID=5467 RepID=A0ACC3YV94_COLTU|nr:metallo-beta-lactamase superfamily protein [Colletotrichum truncatum]KAF6781190.1 metallo-beta-lactamase superfamily protein [Colletotrichum truncatum]
MAEEPAIIFISTGTVQIPKQMMSQPVGDSWAFLRQLRSFRDNEWSEKLPIGVFVISHPQGPILFDTGESTHFNDPSYHPFWAPTKRVSKVEIRPEESITAQLWARGIDPCNIQAIVLSHLHGDHAGGLKELRDQNPDVPVYVSDSHWKAFGNRPLFATASGCAPQHWPKDFKPDILQPAAHAIGPWEASYAITSDRTVFAIDTPGHVPGHVSLVVYGRDPHKGPTTYFLTGDATYSIDTLNAEEPDGITGDPKTALQSIKKIKEFARTVDLVVLPSHDPNTEKMLKERTLYRPGP